MEGRSSIWTTQLEQMWKGGGVKEYQPASIQQLGAGRAARLGYLHAHNLNYGLWLFSHLIS